MDLITQDVVAEVEHLLGLLAVLFATVGVVARFAWKRSVDLRDWRKHVDGTLDDHGSRIDNLEAIGDTPAPPRRRRWWPVSRPNG